MVSESRNIEQIMDVFLTTAFKIIVKKEQELTFCAVGAHRQNGIVEQKIQTITTIVQTLLLHAMSLWPEAISVSLWLFALIFAVERLNRLDINVLGYTPLENLTRC